MNWTGQEALFRINWSSSRMEGYIRLFRTRWTRNSTLIYLLQRLTRKGRSRKRGMLTRLPRRLPREATRCSTEILRLRSEEHTSELQSRENLVCRLLLEKKNA